MPLRFRIAHTPTVPYGGRVRAVRRGCDGTPHRVLCGEANDEQFAFAADPWRAGAPLRIHPSPRRETAMPSKKRVRGDDERCADVVREEPAEAGEDGPVGLGQFGPAVGSLQDRDLCRNAITSASRTRRGLPRAATYNSMTVTTSR